VKVAAIVVLVSLNTGMTLLCFVLDEGRINMRADTVCDRLNFGLFWPWLLIRAALFEPHLLRRPIHAEYCMSRYTRGCCDCPTQRGLVTFGPREKSPRKAHAHGC